VSANEKNRNLAARMGRWSARHRKTAIFGWLAFVVVAFVLGTMTGQKTIDPATAGPGESGRMDKILDAGFKQPAGESVLIQSDSLTTDDPAFRSAVEDVVGTVSRLAVVTNVRSPLDPANQGQISKDGRSALVDFQIRGDSDDAAKKVDPIVAAVDSTKAGIVRDVDDALAGVPGVVGIAGVGATVLDYIDAVYKNFPLTLGLIALVTFVLLVRTFRSILLPVKAVLLNIVSVAATFGATVWFWQEGNGSDQIFDIAPTGAVTFWLPVLIFAFLFGLSMDYEVFILARMREEYDRSGDTDDAVVTGLARTGRLVTGAAMILFLAFLALSSSPGTDIKVFATALGIGILLDATIVRALLVPALVSLFGKWNWWLPAWAAKPLRVEPHAAIPEPRRAEREKVGALD